MRSATERFWANVHKTNTCWLWTMRPAGEGYGQIKLESGRRQQAHRFAYELLVGPIPEGLQLDHLCRVRHCVNPAHLEPVTSRENVHRSPIAPAALNARKTHCPHGHEYTDDNTYFSGGKRICRACNIARAPTRRARVQERHGTPCIDCGVQTARIVLRCASCRKAFERAQTRWTRDTVLVAIQAWVQEHGRAPSSIDWRHAGPTWPNVTTVRKVFGRWNTAIEAAGLPARPCGRADVVESRPNVYVLADRRRNGAA